MKRFESLPAIDAANLPAAHARVVRKLLADLITASEREKGYYAPGEDGFVALLERGDPEEQWLDIFGWALPEAQFEEVTRENGCFVATILNNGYGVSLVIPDEPWLDAAVRTLLARELSPQPGGMVCE
jgi:hypothetical protein